MPELDAQPDRRAAPGVVRTCSAIPFEDRNIHGDRPMVAAARHARLDALRRRGDSSQGPLTGASGVTAVSARAARRALGTPGAAVPQRAVARCGRIPRTASGCSTHSPTAAAHALFNLSSPAASCCGTPRALSAEWGSASSAEQRRLFRTQPTHRGHRRSHQDSSAQSRGRIWEGCRLLRVTEIANRNALEALSTVLADRMFEQYARFLPASAIDRDDRLAERFSIVPAGLTTSSGRRFCCGQIRALSLYPSGLSLHPQQL